ncbi:MAG: AMIN domain-containing protein, partial [Thermodesulfobacteriota bacterium]|nr:AMIN domain-containing protein [Thermodesulfobacteriota bacterium]
MSLPRKISKGISPLIFFGLILLIVTSSGLGEMNPQGKGPSGQGGNLVDIKIEEKGGSIQIMVLADGTISNYKSFELTGPSRLVIDILGFKSVYPEKSVSVNHSLLERIRIGCSPEKVRLVLDIPKGRFAHKIIDRGETLLVLLGPESKDLPTPSPRVQEEEALEKVEQTAAETGARQVESGPEEKIVQKIPKEEQPPLQTIKEPLSQVPPTQELSGKEIVQKVYDRDDGEDSHIKSEMVLLDSRGNRREREMVVQMKDYGQLTKTLIRFTKPAD